MRMSGIMIAVQKAQKIIIHITGPSDSFVQQGHPVSLCFIWSEGQQYS